MAFNQILGRNHDIDAKILGMPAGEEEREALSMQELERIRDIGRALEDVDGIQYSKDQTGNPYTDAEEIIDQRMSNTKKNLKVIMDFGRDSRERFDVLCKHLEGGETRGTKEMGVRVFSDTAKVQSKKRVKVALNSIAEGMETAGFRDIMRLICATEGRGENWVIKVGKFNEQVWRAKRINSGEEISVRMYGGEGGYPQNVFLVTVGTVMGGYSQRFDLKNSENAQAARAFKESMMKEGGKNFLRELGVFAETATPVKDSAENARYMIATWMTVGVLARNYPFTENSERQTFFSASFEDKTMYI